MEMGGSRIRTYNLQIMSLTSYHLLYPANLLNDSIEYHLFRFALFLCSNCSVIPLVVVLCWLPLKGSETLRLKQVFLAPTQETRGKS